MTKYSDIVAEQFNAIYGQGDPKFLKALTTAFADCHRQQMQTVIDTLNEALSLDPKAIQELLECNVDCNQGICDHPTIQVMERADRRRFSLRPLGLINGIIEPITGQRIMAVYDDFDGAQPEKLIRFEGYHPAATRAADPIPQ